MIFVIFAKRNYGITLIIVTIIIVKELIATINFIMSRIPLQKIIEKILLLNKYCHRKTS